ncbi:MAG TPA: hypothetical protein VIT24_02710 [Acidimicrobiales bacterium]
MPRPEPPPRRWARGSLEAVAPAGDPDRGITRVAPTSGVADRIAEAPATASLDRRSGIVALARHGSTRDVTTRPSAGPTIGDPSAHPVTHPAGAHL